MLISLYLKVGKESDIDEHKIDQLGPSLCYFKYIAGNIIIHFLSLLAFPLVQSLVLVEVFAPPYITIT